MSEEPHGFVEWNDWFFDYDMLDSAGLTLLNGHFSGQHVFTKLSLPVVRVKYVVDDVFISGAFHPGGVETPVFGNGCGPYNDQISWDPEDAGDYIESLNPYHSYGTPGDFSALTAPHHLVRIQCATGERYICIQEETDQQNTVWLRLSVYARIGAYHIVQSWFLSNAGELRPRAYSKGLSCNLDHWHHPYWRLHVRLGETHRHKVDIYDGPSKLIQAVAFEGPFVNHPQVPETRYIISNLDNPFTATVIPPALDRSHGIVGVDDFVGTEPFSHMDAYVRRYRPEEDRAWPHSEYEDLSFPMEESILGHEIAFWSVCHLKHHASEGKDHWHAVGPRVLFNVPRIRAPLPHEVRKVTVEVTFHVKDYKLVGSDLWSHQTIPAQFRILEPNALHRAMVLWSQATGDVTANLVIKMDWNPDSSIALHMFAHLFDEGEEVASAENHVSLLINAVGLYKAHLYDHHSGDPDTATIDITITNAQYA